MHVSRCHALQQPNIVMLITAVVVVAAAYCAVLAASSPSANIAATSASVITNSDGQLLFVDNDENITALGDILARIAQLETRAEEQASGITQQHSVNNQQQSTILQLQSIATQQQSVIAQLTAQYCRAVGVFTHAQDIETHEAADWEFFTIANNSFLAIANFFNGNSSNIDSQILVFNETTQAFEPFQLISTQGAWDWQFFTIGNSSYLAVANRHNGSSFNIDSQIYKFDSTAHAFQPFQTIATRGATDWEFFTIGNGSYLAVANAQDDNATYNIDSQIFKFDGSTAFQPFQSIATHGAWDWEFFTIGNASYLAVANFNNDSSFSIDSQIYVFNGTIFLPFQSIATQGAFDWRFFAIGNSSFLAVANRNTRRSSNIDSQIFKFDGNIALNFQPFQNIATHSATDWEFFAINNISFLVVANQQQESGTSTIVRSFNTNSQIFRFDGTLFQPFQLVATQGALDWKFFTIGDTNYLAVANQQDNSNNHNINSQIFSLSLCFF